MASAVSANTAESAAEVVQEPLLIPEASAEVIRCAITNQHWLASPKHHRAIRPSTSSKWAGGFCLLGALFARKINQSSAITIPELLGGLFGSTTVRWIGAVGAILCSSVYLVAQIYGIGLVASMLSGLTFELGVFMALGGILLCSFLGGMRAVTWTQVVQCVVIVASMVALAVAVAWAPVQTDWVKPCSGPSPSTSSKAR